MPLIIEDGSGVANANTYVTQTYVINHLTDRGRQLENDWENLESAAKDGHIIMATDYLENRFRLQFKGVKEFKELKLAKNLLTFGANPLDTETVVVGSRTYTFNTVLGGADSVLIGSNASESLDNLIDAINLDPDGEGVTYGTGTLVHDDVTARAFEDDSIIVEAKEAGVAGNSIATTTSVTGATWTNATLTGGTDTGRPQPLSFPRLNLRDRDGILLTGIPDRLKQAIAEYAVRNAGSTLHPDPDVTTGMQVIEKKEKVDVIEEVTKWQEGGNVQTIIPYPAADALLREFLMLGGTLLRA